MRDTSRHHNRDVECHDGRHGRDPRQNLSRLQRMKAPRIRVVSVEFPPATGWDTVSGLARLCAHLLEADLVQVPHAAIAGRVRRASGMIPRRRGVDVTLVIAPQPVHLNAVLSRRHWWPGSQVTAAWVIDSFWTDRIPHLARHRGHLDHVFITDAEFVDEWTQATGAAVSWAPFGSDVLRHGSSEPTRSVDLQRIGRQPTAWEDDAVVGKLATAMGLVFAGRPPFVPHAAANQQGVRAAMSRAKFTLSFSNAVSPSAYTHPTREYLTGRWTDALAAGATVAGLAPRCAASDELLWPEATVDLSPTSAEEGLLAVREAVCDWTPDRAWWNHHQALVRLDFRWRVRDIASRIGLSSPTLERELAELNDAIRATTAAPGA